MPPAPPALLSSRTAILLTALYAAWAALLLTNFDLHPFASEKLGRVFTDVARHLLHWDFTVDPDVITFEAFVHDGRTYTYFGILPAIARIPLVLLGGEDLQLARISCLLALAIGVYCGIRIVQAAFTLADNRAHPFVLPILIGMATSGPAVYLLAAASIYQEVIFWAAAFTAAFNAIVLRRHFAGQKLQGRDFVCLSVLAGLCLLTRSNCGVALYAALFLLMLADLRASPTPLISGTRVVAGAVTIGFVAMQLTVNWQRWGSPLAFLPWQYYDQFINHPDFMARLIRHGTFAAIRVPFAFAYYVTGLKPEAVAPAFFEDYYGAIEGPRSITTLCAPLIWLFAAYGLVVLVRRSRRSGTPALLLIGNGIAPLLMLGIPFLAVRYSFDGWGTLLIAAALGMRAIARQFPQPTRLIRSGLAGVLLLGILASHLSLLRYKINYSGTDPAIRYALSARLQPLVCPAMPLSPDVKLTDFNPLVTPACPPLW